MNPSQLFRVLLPVGALILFAGLVTGCGDDDDDEEEGEQTAAETEEEEPTATEEATSEATATATEAEAEEGVIAVRAGINDPEDVNIAILENLPESITVSVGTTVRWAIDGPEPHSVTFFPPGQTPPPPGDESVFAPTPLQGEYDGTQFVNSGLIGVEPATFEMPFNTPGEFAYLCVIHPLMTGTVTVVEGEGETQEEIDARAEEELEPFLEEGRAAKEQLLANQVRQQANPDGTTTWFIEMGLTTEHVDVLAFAPPDLDVAAGDSVVFINNSLAPHNAAFTNGNSYDGAPDPAVPGPSPQTLNLTALFNTGTLPPNAPPGAGPPEAVRSYTFVVAEAGTYEYFCSYHAPSEMEGAITAQ